MAGGGLIIFNCDGTIVLGSPLVVSADTVLDAREHNVVISGNDAVQIFAATNKILTLYDLTLTRGAAKGTNGAPAQPGGSAGGGAVLLEGGHLYAEGCRFLTNRAVGGRGGNGTNSPPPPIPIGPREGGNARGGAILAENATLTLINCIFLRNTTVGGAGGASASAPVIFAGSGTGDGGAVWANGGSLAVRACRFEAGGASTSGGATYVTGSEGGFEHCEFNRNSAAAGGAIYCSGPSSGQRFSVIQSAFHTNSASAQGGAILHVDRNLGVTGCTLNWNSATGPNGFTDGRNRVYNAGDGSGGGMCSLAGNLMVTECTFSGNRAAGGGGGIEAGIPPPMPGSGRGGGLYGASEVLVQNCTFAGNEALAGGGTLFTSSNNITGEGGGIFATGGTMRVSFSTIASNAAVSGPTNSTVRGAGYSSSSATLILESSIFSGNTTNGGFGGNGFGPVAGSASGVNLSSDGSVPFSRPNLDPKLLPLADNGGPVATMALHRDSPALDRSTSPNHPSTDARGVRRPQKERPDIGAYEQTFLSIEKASAGTVRIRYDAPPMEQYALEGSDDLAMWEETQTGWSDNTGRLVFDVPTSLSSEMFRVRLIP